MSVFHENVKQIFAEVDKFLNETLKKEKLGKKAIEHRALILEKLTSFLEENPAMKPVPAQDTISVSDDSTMTGGSSKSDESEDAYIDSGLSVVGTADLKDPVYSGFLEKKQKKGAGLFGGSKFQTRWCIIHGGNFYYFSKQEDKKQNGSFRMDGYKFRSAPDLASKKKEKELCFEMYHPDEKKRIYQFMAKNKEDLEQWQLFVESGGHKLIEEDIYEEVGAATASPPATPVTSPPVPPPVTTIKVEDADAAAPDPIQEDVYEDPDSAPPPPPVPTHPPTPKNLPPPPPPPVSRSPVAQPKSPVHKEPEPIVEEGPEEDYDDAITLMAPKTGGSAPPVPGRLMPSTPDIPPPPPPSVPSRPKRDLPELPPVPVAKKKLKVNITCKPEEDFENKFYGKWDCTGDNTSELSFKKGDIIHILNREFDEKSWWIGELNGKFGLVPKNFLVPAYTLVTQ